MNRLVVWPASEVVLPDEIIRRFIAAGEAGGDDEAATLERQRIRQVLAGSASEPRRVAALEHRLPRFYERLYSLFELLPHAAVVLDSEAEQRLHAWLDQIEDAYRRRCSLARVQPVVGGSEALPADAPERLYLRREELATALDMRSVLVVGAGGADALELAAAAVPNFADGRDAIVRVSAYIMEQRKAGQRVILCAGSDAERTKLARLVERHAGASAAQLHRWSEVAVTEPASLASLVLELSAGFTAPGLTVLTSADVLGAPSPVAATGPAIAGGDAFATEALRPGDLVVHAQHGIGRLAGLERLDQDEIARECLSINYAGGQKLLVPTDEIDTIWRYGSGDSLALDRLTGDAWATRRQEVEAQVAQVAAALVEHARARARQQAPRLVPPRSAYNRFVSRFPYTETVDQRRAIDAVLAHLASGRPMQRLVCGDVGFGKTEVALRAAAAAALAGKQVAVVAPTTVLVRQHLETFRYRFAGFDVRVEGLARSSRTAASRAVLRGLASGEVHIIVGTQALASAEVRFADLGLVIIDEEQRFGTQQKEELGQLQAGMHVLMMTATPIPRTLQAAKAGLLDLSVIATPPVRRRPIRTVVVPFDGVVVREALLREQMHGGQSFVVCSRITDLEPIRARLSELLPELDLVVAHGRMKTETLDELMVAFARGEHDLLLTTNIIESGLDIPSANTMLIWHPDRFGLADLHQLRGRVGRGRARGSVYLLLDPEAKVAETTRRRLETLQNLAGLGAGFAIGARDLDLRGAGDLLGSEQSGHVKLVGTGLYQHLFEAALRRVRGEPEDGSPQLRLGIAGYVPQEYVPEEENRIELYRKLVGLRSSADVLSFEEELADRFGQPPPPLKDALALAALRLRCREAGITAVDAGPNGVALRFCDGAAPGAAAALSAQAEGEFYWTGDRLVLPLSTQTPAERLEAIDRLLERIESVAGRARPTMLHAAPTTTEKPRD